ncbi:UDP-glucose 4-epimerase GalE [Caproiciproducens sp. NJN-50]|uniref:UDP-glucose 4-epimerase GalE n=1 Tax=Acutalibacteraceae TaxID=3082771 RepID=UPI000FFE3080|nr:MULTISPECIES: UDP-glucose 4-epimerase GalE [Acutalibacteraceae]QAT51116.1 UDP-glucose 4-epimerase GalE [Caproiciproducens sp. NJN-50]
MNILITGGAGYIGSHTCVELLQSGFDIVVMDNYSNASPDVIGKIEALTGKKFPAYECDMLDEEGFEKIFQENDIDAVIHFAGLKAVGESVAKPLEYYRNNLTGTLNLFRLMRRHGVKKFVFSSSATVYGMNNQAPFTEEMPLSATNPYGWTKYMIEQITRDACRADPDMKSALLRYFNPIGAHPSGLIGENPNGIPNNLMPYIMKVAVGKLPKLHVYGSDYPTPDGTGVRDYIHVCDLAAGHAKALQALNSISGARAFNLGTGKGSSVLDVVHAFEEASGVKIPYQIDPRRAGDIATCYADPSRAKEELHWEAKFTLSDMCRDSWNFIRKNS